ncbi:DUF5991 domain-containing protein [bacterium]|nr:DUF5991 domain-containing protein [bacterium]
MTDFSELHDYSSDELIEIVYLQNEGWQIEAIQYAKEILHKRGISDKKAQKWSIAISEEIEKERLHNLYERSIESYNIFDKIMIAIFPFRYIFRDWNLLKNGYIKKSKQRLFAMGIGAIGYVIIYLWVQITSPIKRQNELIEFDKKAIADSLALLEVDWSGVYIFKDELSNHSEKISWEIDITKDGMSHSADIELFTKGESLKLTAYGIIKGNYFELYPDSTFHLLKGEKVVRYDRLLTFTYDSTTLVTYWGKMKPYYGKNISRDRLFEKVDK